MNGSPIRWGSAEVMIGLMIVLGGCFRLDDFMYEPERTSFYLLNRSPRALPMFPIPDSLIHLFSLDAGGKRIYGVYVGRWDQLVQDTILVYCHGNTGNLDYYWDRIQLLAYLGGQPGKHFAVIAMDYPGYGMSEGEPSEEGIYMSVYAVLEWLARQGVSGNRVVLYGFSMGTAPATPVTAFPKVLVPGALILEAPFASPEMIAQDAVQFALPGAYVTDLEMRVADWIQFVEQPFLHLHGLQDELLPYEPHGRLVYERYKGRMGRQILIPEAGHSNIPDVMGYTEYIRAIREFVRIALQ